MIPAQSKRLGYGLAVVLCTAICASPAGATEIYSYEGNPYTGVDGQYTTSMFVSGTFTVPTALASNLTDVTITPAAFAFSDGVFPINNTEQSNIDSFSISTDALGNIISCDIHIDEWEISYSTPDGEIDVAGDLWIISGVEDYVHFHEYLNDSLILTSDGESLIDGQWGPAVNPSIPEPGTVSLAFGGLIAFVYMTRHHNARRIQPPAGLSN